MLGNGTIQQQLCPLGGFDELTVFIVPVNLVTALLAAVGNLLVVLSIARFSVLRASPTNHFVAALAAADFAVALMIPYYTSFYLDVPYICNLPACQVKNAVAMWTTLCSFLLLVGVALDRYVSIVHPLTYPQLVDARVSVTAIGLIFFYVTFIIGLPYALPAARLITDDKDLIAMGECDLVYVFRPAYVLIWCCHLLFSFAATTFLYGVIFREAWRQNRSVAQHLRHEAKTALMMVLIFGVSIISTVPYLIVVGVRYSYFQDDRIDQTTLSRAKKIVICLFFSKSALNPFIYGWKNRDFRFAFIRLLHCFPCSRQWEPEMNCVPAVPDIRPKAVSLPMEHPTNSLLSTAERECGDGQPIPIRYEQHDTDF